MPVSNNISVFKFSQHSQLHYDCYMKGNYFYLSVISEKMSDREHLSCLSSSPIKMLTLEGTYRYFTSPRITYISNFKVR